MAVRTDLTKYEKKKARDLAEEVCWELLLAIHLNGLDNVDSGWRKLIGEPLEKWSQIVLTDEE